MVCVVMLSRRLHINPDNVATPIAASLGDLTTISLLAGISMFLFNTLGKPLQEVLNWGTRLSSISRLGLRNGGI